MLRVGSKQEVHAGSVSADGGEIRRLKLPANPLLM